MKLVHWLRARCFDTTDAGDVLPESAHHLVSTAQRVAKELRHAGVEVLPGMVQAVYDPVNGSAVISLFGVSLP